MKKSCQKDKSDADDSKKGNNGKKSRFGKKKITRRVLIIASAAAVCFCAFATGYLYKNSAQSADGGKQKQSDAVAETKTARTNQISEKDNEDEIEQTVQDIMENMSLEEMVYQMMFVTPETITNVGSVIQAGDATKAALEKYPVGGIVYFANNLQNREQTVQMLKNTQSFSKIPLFLSVDEEGGRVARLGRNPKMETTKLPPMREIGDTGDTQKALEVGQTLAGDLSSLGFNVDFAPDADVLINPDNTEIGDRSFGSDPELVARMVKGVVTGLQSNGVSATLKHFPGHGSTSVNSHAGFSESTRTLEELRSTEFLPFKAGIEAGADFVMVSHMTLSAATEEKVPSSLSKEVITDMLIGELGFEGIVITDSFGMGAITEEYSPKEAAVKAVSAGADMILMTGDLPEIHRALMDAVNSGEIKEERIEQSVRKILTVKVKQNIITR